MKLTHFLLALTVSFSTGIVWAESKQTGPCHDDIQKFCKDVPSGHGAILRCLKDHEDQLSADCRAKGTELRARVSNLRQACREDAAKFCQEFTPGKGRLLRCLKDHQNEVSEECQAALPSGFGSSQS